MFERARESKLLGWWKIMNDNDYSCAFTDKYATLSNFYWKSKHAKVHVPYGAAGIIASVWAVTTTEDTM